MGEVVVAAVVAHQPMMMVPEKVRVELGGTGKDTTLIEPGFRLLREALSAHEVDTLVIFDTHWFTTTEEVIAGAEHFKGLYTSEEMPRNICDLPYDYPGAPELARVFHAVGKERGLYTVNVTTASLPQHYATLNLVQHLRTHEKVLSCSTVQTGEASDYLALGEALGEAVKRVPGARVALLGSGGMSHRFWSLSTIRDHFEYGAEHVISDDARAMDARILELWKAGDHAAVLDLYPEYRAYAPEGRFSHYLMLVGALGGAACHAPGRQLSDYENAVGTGQVHVLFELDAVAS